MLDTRPRLFALIDPSTGGSGTTLRELESRIDQWLHTIGMDHDVVTGRALRDAGWRRWRSIAW